MVFHLANTYAAALFDVASTEQQKALAIQGLKEMVRFQQSAEGKHFLSAPHIPLAEKVGLLREHVIPKEASFLEGYFIQLLRKKRLNILPLILSKFEKLNYESQGVQPVIVRSAMPLSTSNIASLKKYVKTLTDKKIELHFEEDKTILAGFALKINNIYLDYSLATQMKHLQQFIKGLQNG